MRGRGRWKRWGVLALSFGLGAQALAAPAHDARPSFVWIVADDLGPGVLGSHGQRRIRTPRLDRLAAQGTRYTQFYAGAPVCKPSREVLLTGRHTGRTTLRGNVPIALPDEAVTVAELLAEAGYATAAIGKWGLGGADTSGAPWRQGFAHWFGYLNQRRAHNAWPDYLMRGSRRVWLGNAIRTLDRRGASVATRRRVYAPDLLLAEAVAFIEAHAGEPFFLLYATPQPHANSEQDPGMEIPELGAYADEPWPPAERGYAAVVSELDRHVGVLADALEGTDTVLFFSADNGPHAEGGVDPAFFGATGGLRGHKRDLYEGGIRVPMIAHAPGRIPAGRVDDTPWAMWDWLPTVVELAGLTPPTDLDGRSAAALLRGEAWTPSPVLYWELHTQGSAKRALRRGELKVVVEDGGAALFDLGSDPAERVDLAAEHPELVRELRALMEDEHDEDTRWPLR